MVKSDRNQEIKFGIFCNGTSFPAWQTEAIKKLLSLENVSCKLLVIDDTDGVKKPVNRNFKHLLWHTYRRVSERMTRSFRKIDLSGLFDGVQSINCRTINNDPDASWFSTDDIDLIKGYGLDFILGFGFGNIRGKILDAARFGIWSFRYGNEQDNRWGPACFWEIYRNDYVTGACLQRILDTPGTGILLKDGFVKTKYSLAKNRDQIYQESSRWPAHLCQDIRNGHTEKFRATPSGTGTPVYQAPGNCQLIWFWIKLFYLNIRRAAYRFFYTDYWTIGVAKAPISAFLAEEKPDVDWYPLRSRNRFLADPFCFADDKDKDKLHIYLETYPYWTARGKLDYILYDKGFGPEQKLISEDFHLSYPYTIRYKGDCYLVPESAEANMVFSYKAINFPLQWEKSNILIDGFAGIDNSIIEHENTYWLFATDRHDGFRYNLKIYYADDLFGKWNPHPKNPVKTDIRSARPAGTPFFYKGAWYRPSMDYREKEEGRIIINKVLNLSRTEFEEDPVKILDPYPNIPFPDKIHTLCEVGDYTIIDACKEAFIFSSPHFFMHQLNWFFRWAKKKFK